MHFKAPLVPKDTDSRRLLLFFYTLVSFGLQLGEEDKSLLSVGEI